MSEPVYVSSPNGVATISVNGGPACTIPVSSRDPQYIPAVVSDGPVWDVASPGPNQLATGPNTVTVTLQVPGFDIPPKTFTIDFPPNTFDVGDSCQLYLFLDWTCASVTWNLLVGGLLVAVGNSTHGQMPWPIAPPSTT